MLALLLVLLKLVKFWLVGVLVVWQLSVGKFGVVLVLGRLACCRTLSSVSGLQSVMLAVECWPVLVLGRLPCTLPHYQLC